MYFGRHGIDTGDLHIEVSVQHSISMLACVETLLWVKMSANISYYFHTYQVNHNRHDLSCG